MTVIATARVHTCQVTLEKADLGYYYLTARGAGAHILVGSPDTTTGLERQREWRNLATDALETAGAPADALIFASWGR